MSSRQTDPLPYLIADAFEALCEAEKLIYAGGGGRIDKDYAIAAHSALLQLTIRHPVKQ